MNDRPDPADDNWSEQQLENAEKQGVAVESIASTGRDHGADSRREWEAVQDEAHDGESMIERNDRCLASTDSLITFI